MDASEQEYTSPPVGHQITAVLFGVRKDIIRDGELIWQHALESLEADGFTVLHKHPHFFVPVGMTGTIVLSESHLNIHTYPQESEGRSLYFHLYSCLGVGHGEKTFAEFLRRVPHESHKADRMMIPILSQHARLMPSRMPARRLRAVSGRS